MSHGYMDPDLGGGRQGFMVLAASRDVFAGKRIVNVSGLNQYYRDMGAYDDITPDDDDDSTFTPAQPPPVPPCAGSTVVANTPDRSLVRDCENLLGL